MCPLPAFSVYTYTPFSRGAQANMLTHCMLTSSLPVSVRHARVHAEAPPGYGYQPVAGSSPATATWGDGCEPNYYSAGGSVNSAAKEPKCLACPPNTSSWYRSATCSE